MKLIDIIILSYAKTEKHYNLTVNCLDSLKKSKLSKLFNIIVIETKEGVSYNFDGVKTAHLKEPFNYNKFANYGASLGDCELIGVFNNDVIFNENWFVEIIHNFIEANSGFYSCSPISLTSSTQNEFRHIKPFAEGYEIAKHISGWAIVLTRKLWQHLKGFDTRVSFWCSDDAYSEQLKAANVKHYLITTSIVNHVENGSNTLKTLDEETKQELTYNQAKQFNKLYNANKFNLN